MASAAGVAAQSVHACGNQPLAVVMVDQLTADKAILRGRVPTLVEWQDAWVELTETLSLRKQAQTGT